MATKILRSDRPLNPIGDRAALLCRQAEEVFLASGFVTRRAIDVLIKPALERGAMLKLVTGTYGGFNRHAMFERLLSLTAEYPRFEARIWRGDKGGAFHGKLYIWRLPRGRGEAWIGSANFTDGGFTNDGEIMLAEIGRWDAPAVRRLHRAFLTEWKRSVALDQTFLRNYREAGHLPPDARQRRPRPTRRKDARLLITNITHHFADDSLVSERINDAFPQPDSNWVRCTRKAAREARLGDQVCVVDRVDNVVYTGPVLRSQADGSAWVIHYRPELECSWRATSKRALRTAGVTINKSGSPRMTWLDGESGTQLVQSLRRLRI
jgi:HKD family nuclease